MFRKLRKSSQIACPVLFVSDPHVTSPGQEEATIIRKDSIRAAADESVDIYERARQIYYRAKRSGRRRSAGII